jgi:hypothetical protein
VRRVWSRGLLRSSESLVDESWSVPMLSLTCSIQTFQWKFGTTLFLGKPRLEAVELVNKVLPFT